MRILVGVMHCIENELDACLAAIRGQTHQDHEMFLVQNLPNRKAHNTLYQTFMQRASEFDFFIKIDADMVLARATFFEEVIDKMQYLPEADNLQIAVHDYFTNQLIYGLHIFRSTVRWNVRSNERVFVDRIELINKRVNDKTELAPAAYHCSNPSDFQAFHYGIHKGVKVIQRNNMFQKDYFSAYFHWNNILRIEQHYLATRDNRLALAYIGAYLAMVGKFSDKQVDYTNALVKELFSRLQSGDRDDIKRIFRYYQKKLHRYPPAFKVEYLLWQNSHQSYLMIKRAVTNLIKGKYKQQIKQMQ